MASFLSGGDLVARVYTAKGTETIHVLNHSELLFPGKPTKDSFHFFIRTYIKKRVKMNGLKQLKMNFQLLFLTCNSYKALSLTETINNSLFYNKLHDTKSNFDVTLNIANLRIFNYLHTL